MGEVIGNVVGNRGGLYCLRLSTMDELSDVMEELFEAAGLDAVSWQYNNDGAMHFEVYFDEESGAEAGKATVLEMLRERGLEGRARVTVSWMGRRDWEDAWKDFFHVQRVSDRLVIKPSWEEWNSEVGDCVITLDPGMSFGTGQHATTRGCLAVLDRMSAAGRGGSLLDVGCGSGVVSIAAALLGYGPVLAIDLDPVAVDAARVNVESNAVSGRVECVQGDIRDWVAPGSFRTVVANMLAGELVEAAPHIVPSLSEERDAVMVLAGMLHEQEGGIAELYRGLGLEVLETIRDPLWSVLVLGREGRDRV